MKRKFQETLNHHERFSIDSNFIDSCNNNFHSSVVNTVVKNAITNIGSYHASIDHEEIKKVSHVFLNSLKKKNIKVTNQGASGRCWLFSGLNIFRHTVINALDLENFEFSETYLFFWDKLERANCFLQWVNELLYKGKEINNDDYYFQYLIESDRWMSDGGYWNYFANLVEKYGLTPKTAMPETFQSDYSADMNDVIIDILHSCSVKLSKMNIKNPKRELLIKDTLKQVYNTLVKFLGEPPKTFSWNYVDSSGEAACINGLTPMSFKEMVIPGINLNDFVVLCNIPSKKYKYYKKYSINNTNNVIESNECITINLPINELKKYAKQSILGGFPVWFAGDINKGFNPTHSVLNDSVNNSDKLFGDKACKMNKEDRIQFLNQKTSHAMTLVGVNIGENGKTRSWQVENSWGFYDNETPGLDGFLCMDDKWFDEYLGQIVVHKIFLSRNLRKIVESEEKIRLEPWESLAPALKIEPFNVERYMVNKK